MEWKKLIYRKRIFGTIIALLVIIMLLFSYSVKKEMRETEEENNLLEEEQLEQKSYEENFNDEIQSIIDQADFMGGISIFSNEDSFVQKNLDATKEDFKKMLSVKPVEFEESFLLKFFSFSILNITTILAGIIVACLFVEANKQGLRSMIFSSQKGRGTLVLLKIGSMVMWDAVIVAVFYGIILLESGFLYKCSVFECLRYPVQSISIFWKLPWSVNIGEFLAAYFVYKWIVLVFISLLVWMILYLTDNMIVAGGIAGIIGLIEYLLYNFIGSMHPLCILRYCNIWYQISECGFFSEYKNLNIFSYAVNKNILIVLTGFVGIVLMTIISTVVGMTRRPFKSKTGKLRKIEAFVIGKIKKVVGGLQEMLTIKSIELYKILVTQKALLVVVVLLLFVASQTDYEPIVKSGKQELYYNFMERYTGIPSTESQKEIDEFESMLSEIKDEYIAAMELYQNGEISVDEYTMADLKYNSYEKERLFLSQIKEQTDYISNHEGAWYVNLYSYTHLLDEGDVLQDILLLMTIVLLCSGIFSIEKQYGTDFLIRQTVNGRRKVFMGKIRASLILTFLLYAIITAMRIAESVAVYGIGGLGAPVYSIPILSFIPFKCSILTFLIGLYVVKFIVLVAVDIFVCMFSSRTSQKAAIGLSLILSIPALLSMVGVEVLKYLSITNILSIVPFMLQVRNVALVGAAVVIFVIVGIISFICSYRKWCIT